MTDREFPFEDVEIRTPNALRRVIEDVHRLMDEGEIEHTDQISILPYIRPHIPIEPEYLMAKFPQYPAIEPEDFRSLPSNGPWSDIIYGVFRHRDGQWFELSVETYHGSGGRWRQVPEESIRRRKRKWF